MLNGSWMFLFTPTTRAYTLSLGNTLPDHHGVKPCFWDQAANQPPRFAATGGPENSFPLQSGTAPPWDCGRGVKTRLSSRITFSHSFGSSFLSMELMRCASLQARLVLLFAFGHPRYTALRCMALRFAALSACLSPFRKLRLSPNSKPASARFVVPRSLRGFAAAGIWGASAKKEAQPAAFTVIGDTTIP